LPAVPNRLPVSRSHLRFERRGESTALVDAHAELPLLVQRPLRASNGGAVVTLLTPAAALFDGDAIDLHVDCPAGTDVTLVTTGATRLNRGCITFTMVTRVADGATFRHLPYELIPFTDATYRQRIDIDIQPGGSAILLEVVTPGSSAAPFSYASLDFETAVHLQGTLLARERFTLTSASRAALHGRTHYASLLAFGPDFTAQAAEAAHAALAHSDIWASASLLPNYGIALKALGTAATSLREALLAALPPCSADHVVAHSRTEM
jgi:urease accessory protein UreH